MSSFVRVWTIQPETVWHALQTEGVLFVDPAQSSFGEDFASAYAWMRGQMQKRIPGYQGHWPWWAWVCPKPDLRHFRHQTPPGQVEYRLELLLPENTTLVSDFNAWHAVLNGSFLALSEGEDNAFDAEWEALYQAHHLLSPARMLRLYERDRDAWEQERARGAALFKPLQERKEASWQRIFDMEAMSQNPYWGDGTEQQACFEQLELSSVQSVTRFVGAQTPCKKKTS